MFYFCSTIFATIVFIFLAFVIKILGYLTFAVYFSVPQELTSNFSVSYTNYNCRFFKGFSLQQQAEFPCKKFCAIANFWIRPKGDSQIGMHNGCYVTKTSTLSSVRSYLQPLCKCRANPSLLRPGRFHKFCRIKVF